MSNSLAIAAVTATLRNLIRSEVGDLPNGNVTTEPPDKVRSGNATPDQLNIFLYQTSINPAWRNMDIPTRVRPGETGQPPLALNLSYLITAYGEGDDETRSQRWLGAAMRVLHDHPVLGSQEIKDALSGSDLETQVERVRITPLPMSLEELSKLWIIFQTQYRVSTAYAVEVVLIDSERPVRTPLPVLTRGEDDSGVAAQPDLIPPFPTLAGLSLAQEKQPSAQLGESITLQGHHLHGDSLVARFRNVRLSDPIDIVLQAIAADSDVDINVSLPDGPADRAAWASGFYTVALVVGRSGESVNKVRETNELPLSVAPRILSIVPDHSSAGSDFSLQVRCSPNIMPEQRASLLFGNNEIPADAHGVSTDTLDFHIPADAAQSPGKYYVRLRLDGVDSLLVDYSTTPPAFDDTQMVTLT